MMHPNHPLPQMGLEGIIPCETLQEEEGESGCPHLSGAHSVKRSLEPGPLEDKNTVDHLWICPIAPSRCSGSWGYPSRIPHITMLCLGKIHPNIVRYLGQNLRYPIVKIKIRKKFDLKREFLAQCKCFNRRGSMRFRINLHIVDGAK